MKENSWFVWLYQETADMNRKQSRTGPAAHKNVRAQIAQGSLYLCLSIYAVDLLIFQPKWTPLMQNWEKKKFRCTKKLNFIIFGPQIEVDRHRPEIKILAKNVNDAEWKEKKRKKVEAKEKTKKA